jgi:hypothetical protein
MVVKNGVIFFKQRLPFPLACRKRRLNGTILRMKLQNKQKQKLGNLCHSMLGLRKTPPLSTALRQAATKIGRLCAKHVWFKKDPSLLKGPELSLSLNFTALHRQMVKSPLSVFWRGM